MEEKTEEKEIGDLLDLVKNYWNFNGGFQPEEIVLRMREENKTDEEIITVLKKLL